MNDLSPHANQDISGIGLNATPTGTFANLYAPVFFLDSLPAPIAQSVAQSGIMDEPGDLSWLEDPLVLKCLDFANQAHYDAKRKRSDLTRLVHEIWCAHQIHNDGNLAQWLDDNKVPRQWAVSGMILHDLVENQRDQAHKLGIPFREADTLESMRVLLDNAPMFDYLSGNCFPFMTDREGLHGGKRLAAQRAKAYNTEGKFSITYLQQKWRIYDKLSNVVFDARYCKEELQRIGERYRQPVEKTEESSYTPLDNNNYERLEDPESAILVGIAALKETARTGLKQALARNFVFVYPAAKQDSVLRKKGQAMHILKKISGSLVVELTRTFHGTAEEMLAAQRRVLVPKPRRRAALLAALDPGCETA